jgi:hypothetical protein
LAAAETTSGIDQFQENGYEPAVLDPQDSAMAPKIQP